MLKHHILKTYLLIYSIIAPFFTFAQYWNKRSFEGIYGIGASNLMAEVGSPNANIAGIIEENFYLRPPSFRPVITVGGRYGLNQRMAIKACLNFANLSAADAYGDWRWENRITNSLLIELGGQFEYFIIKEKQRQNKYRLITKHKFSGLNIPTYFFTGIYGAVFFSKTEANERYFGNKGFYLGKEIAYREIFKRPEKYSHFTPVIPFGFGVKFRLNKIIRLGVEAGWHFTFTDYLDERIVKTPDNILPYWPDSYQFLLFSLNYKLNTGRNGLPRIKFRF